MLSLFRDEEKIGRLEQSGRLLRRRIYKSIFAVAAEDLGETLRFVRVKDLAERGVADAQTAWTQIQDAFTARANTLSHFGLPPFWFVDCPDWPPSAFLMWHGLSNWAAGHLKTDRPLMAAAFSANQLILGLADSAEFHNRLSHAHQAPAEQPLFPVPFLLTQNGPPRAIARIDLALGHQVTLYPEDEGEEISLSLIPD